MAKRSQDWRETEERLRELPDHELRKALADAGVKAVLPSDRKARSTHKSGGDLGDSTTRWANGEWQERISLEDLPDAQKFLEDPNKPPTQAVPRAAALTNPAPARRPWAAMVTGLVVTASVLGFVVYELRDEAFLDRPRVEARTQAPAARAADAAAEAVAAATAAMQANGEQAAAKAEAPGANAKPKAEAALAAPVKAREADAKVQARPAGSPADGNEEAREQLSQRLRFLARQAQRGDVPAMISLARALVDRGDAETAMKWAGRAKMKRRNSIEARIVLGDAQMLAGYGKAAEETWRGALARAPGNEELKQRLGE